MASNYKFVSREILERNDLIDLDLVFPEAQRLAKERGKVAFGLNEIVLYIKDQTFNFSATTLNLIDLDQALAAVVDSYFKSKDEVNPYKDQIQTAKAQLKTPVTVKDGVIQTRTLDTPPKEAVAVKEVKKLTLTPLEKIKKRIDDWKFFVDEDLDFDFAEAREVYEFNLEISEIDDSDENIEIVSLLKGFLEENNALN